MHTYVPPDVDVLAQWFMAKIAKTHHETHVDCIMHDMQALELNDMQDS